MKIAPVSSIESTGHRGLPHREVKPDPDCLECGGTGWRTVDLPSAVRPGQTEPRAQRCPCCGSEANPHRERTLAS